MTELETLEIKEPSIRDIPQLFNILTPSEQDFLLDNHSISKFKKNAIIYKEGETPSHLMCLVKGKVKLFKEGIGGRDQIVRMASGPEYIGYRALFAEEKHIATAVVIEPCLIFLVPKEAIFKLMATNNLLCMNIIKSFATELGLTRHRIVSLTQKHIRGRLAESLMLLRKIYGFENDGTTLAITLSREDLANFSNMTTSNAIRTLSTFADEKVIHIEGRSIKIMDEKMLERISRLG